MMKRVMGAGLPLAAALLASTALAQTAATPQAGALTYQQPPQPIADILDSKPTPSSMLSPDRSTLVLMDRSNLPSIKALSEPMLRLAGYRINPRNNGPAESRVAWLTGLSLQAVDGGQPRVVALPDGARFTAPRFSPDGTEAIYSVATSSGASSCRSAKRSSSAPLWREPMNSPGPRMLRSWRAISKPSVCS